MSENIDPNIKTIQLTGGVTTGSSEGKSRKKGSSKNPRKTFKVDMSKSKEGGGSTSPGTLTQLSASHTPSGDSAAPEPVGVDAPLTTKGAPVGGAKALVQTQAQTPMKVVLAAANKTPRVVLGAASAKKTPTPDSKTRKVSRAKKLRVTISSLGKKIHTAKIIRKKATDSTIEEIKKSLQKAGLIKVNSKAPETMLRQMYADYMTLKGRAL